MQEIQLKFAMVPYFLGASRCLVFLSVLLVISREHRLFPSK